MLYVIYDKSTDIDDFVNTSLTSALTRAGELLDTKDITEFYFVSLYDMTEEEYNNNFVTGSDAEETYTLKGFVKQFGLDQIPSGSKERYHNLDRVEQIEVLKFTPDELLLEELSRRMIEYRKYADAIREANERLLIYV